MREEREKGARVASEGGREEWGRGHHFKKHTNTTTTTFPALKELHYAIGWNLC